MAAAGLDGEDKNAKGLAQAFYNVVMEERGQWTQSLRPIGGMWKRHDYYCSTLVTVWVLVWAIGAIRIARYTKTTLTPPSPGVPGEGE